MADLTSNINYLQPTAFKLVIDRKKFGNLEYFAQTISHPSVSMNTAPLPYKRANIHMAADKLTFGSLSANIILDENMAAYTEMYDWAKRLVENVNTTKVDARNRYVSEGDIYTTAVDITVSILSSHNNMTKRIRYVDCVLTDIGDINFQSTSADIQYLTFPVTFEFSYFDII